MAAALVANETEIANALGVFGLGNLANDVLDEIELDRRLSKSLKQFETGQTMSVDEAERRMAERFASGYYGKK